MWERERERRKGGGGGGGVEKRSGGEGAGVRRARALSEDSSVESRRGPKYRNVGHQEGGERSKKRGTIDEDEDELSLALLSL